MQHFTEISSLSVAKKVPSIPTGAAFDTDRRQALHAVLTSGSRAEPAARRTSRPHVRVLSRAQRVHLPRRCAAELRQPALQINAVQGSPGYLVVLGKCSHGGGQKGKAEGLLAHALAPRPPEQCGSGRQRAGKGMLRAALARGVLQPERGCSLGTSWRPEYRSLE